MVASVAVRCLGLRDVRRCCVLLASHPYFRQDSSRTRLAWERGGRAVDCTWPVTACAESKTFRAGPKISNAPILAKPPRGAITGTAASSSGGRQRSCTKLGRNQPKAWPAATLHRRRLGHGRRPRTRCWPREYAAARQDQHRLRRHGKGGWAPRTWSCRHSVSCGTIVGNWLAPRTPASAGRRPQHGAREPHPSASTRTTASSPATARQAHRRTPSAYSDLHHHPGRRRHFSGQSARRGQHQEGFRRATESAQPGEIPVKPHTRLLAIDPGKVRLGLAISDTERRIASPLTTYTRRDPVQDAHYFKKIVADQEVAVIVIGLPIHEDGGLVNRHARSVNVSLISCPKPRCVKLFAINCKRRSRWTPIRARWASTALRNRWRASSTWQSTRWLWVEYREILT